MRTRSAPIVAILLVVGLATPAAATQDDPAVDAQSIAEEAASSVCDRQGLEVPDECGLLSFDRTEVAGRIVEYTFGLRVGSGEFDRLTIHRVVEERKPFVPQSRPEGIMLLHGDLWPFAGVFTAAVGSGVVPDEQALPVYLADNGVDAWGVDLRWAGVPGDVPNPNAIMQDWGQQTDIDDIGVALDFMRTSRLLTRSGFQKVTLLGWSRGGITGYAYLNMESQQLPAIRHVKAFIPVDIYVKTDDDSRRQIFCAAAQSTADQIEQGIHVANFSILAIAGELAINEPNGPSPLIPGFTNGQVIVLDAGLPRDFVSPWFHYLGAEAVGGIPANLLFTVEPLAYVHYARASSFMPNKLILESSTLVCDEEDSPFDDHLSDITVPVLYVAADGGASDLGVYSTTLLGTKKVETLIVDLSEVNEEDFGHTDIFLATEAEQYVWAPLLDWIKRH